MATTTGTKASATAPIPGHGYHYAVYSRECSVALATTQLDNADDGVELFWLPAGAVVVGAQLRVTDMDSSTGLLFDLGDAVDDDRLLVAFSGQAAGHTAALAAAGWGYLYTAATKIILSVNTAATTGVAGTAYVQVSFRIDPNYVLTT